MVGGVGEEKLYVVQNLQSFPRVSRQNPSSQSAIACIKVFRLVKAKYLRVKLMFFVC